MIQCDNSNIDQIIIHQIGNKFLGDNVILSNNVGKYDESIVYDIAKYFVGPFNFNEIYHFSSNVDVKYNFIYSIVRQIFNNDISFVSGSQKMATYLFDQGTNKSIRQGMFYVVKFRDCLIDNECLDAIGLFKSETEDTFLKLYSSENGYQVKSEKGLGISKLDKGCIIFNKDESHGYIMSVVEKSNKKIEKDYWINDFLQIKVTNNSYLNTLNLTKVINNFIDDIKEKNVITTIEKATLKNDCKILLKEQTNFQQLVPELFKKDNIREMFSEFLSSYSNNHETTIDESLSLDQDALKKKNVRSVIKLDDNIEINIKGNGHDIVQGFDKAKDKKFYKIYYDNEK